MKKNTRNALIAAVRKNIAAGHAPNPETCTDASDP